MRSSGLRALVLASFAVAVFAVLGLGYTDADLLVIVQTEFIPEISVAAGANLVDYFYETYDEAELLELAEYGDTPGIKHAAIQALKLYRIFINPIEDLVAGYTSEELQDMGETDLLAARAYYWVLWYSGGASFEDLEAAAAGTDLFAIAAGELLGGYYAPGSFKTLTVDEAIDLAENGATPGLRLAGGIALATYILIGESDYGADMTDAELMVGATAATGWDLGLAHVYQTLLTQRFAN
ncbi:MAG: hypothetical protein JSW65_00145 [Candidatus Bipolaricaulota bacterium]|nr:MAG: hypothetical protein JSW65_00145 [Candidatus Bipolaricaulota bacterium]